MAVPVDPVTLDLDAPSRAMPKPAPVAPAVPPESPLAMPVQDLTRWSEADAHPVPGRRSPWGARAFVFGGGALLTAYGAVQMYEVVSVAGSTTWVWTSLKAATRSPTRRTPSIFRR